MTQQTIIEPTLHRLDSGALLAVETIPSAKSAALAWLTPAGAASDPDNRQGAAAIIEELLLRGTTSKSSKQQADAFDLIGASRATSAQTLHMQFSATFLGARFNETAELVADSILRPAFAEDAIDPARQLALQSLKGLDDEPQTKVMLAARAAHAAAPFDRSGMGTAEGLTATTRQDIQSHWDTRAAPEGSIIALAGAIDPSAAADTLNALLDGWQGAATPPAYAGPGPRGCIHLDSPSEQTHIAVIHDAPPEAHEDAALERVAISVLSGGMSGRLFTEVREKRGLCYAVSAGYASSKEYARVVAYSGTTPERAQDTLDVLTAELRRINTPDGAVTQDELDRAKIGLKSKLVMSGESTSARASALAADVARLDRPRSLTEAADAIEAVTIEKLNAYLARRDLGKLTTCTLGPKALNAN